MAGGKIFQREIYFAKVCRYFFDIFDVFLDTRYARVKKYVEKVSKMSKN